MTIKNATIYRMVMTDHMCPSGLKAHELLHREGFQVEDNHLKNRAEVDAFKAEHDVPTTPQIFIDGQRVGGYEALLAHLGKAVDKEKLSYRPVVYLFGVAALMAMAVTWLVMGRVLAWQSVEWFIAISMVLLGLQKLRDIDQFATMFLTYDLLAQRWVRFGHVYPFIETGAGLLMLAGMATLVAAPVTLVAATIGAVSVYKAVYIDRRDLKCACVGGDSNVPLGFVSLTENLMMIGMSIWMLIKMFAS